MRERFMKDDLSNSRTSTDFFLKTARAYQVKIDKKLAQKEASSCFPPELRSVLSPLVPIRKVFRDLHRETSIAKVHFSLREDDEYGWPRVQLSCFADDVVIAELTVGAQDRRQGAVIYMRESASGVVKELQEAEYENKELTDRSLRVLIRAFFESIQKNLSDGDSIEKKVAQALQILPEEGVRKEGIREDSSLKENQETLRDDGGVSSLDNLNNKQGYKEQQENVDLSQIDLFLDD
jgi:hypothetical protein